MVRIEEVLLSVVGLATATVKTVDEVRVSAAVDVLELKLIVCASSSPVGTGVNVNVVAAWSE